MPNPSDEAARAPSGRSRRGGVRARSATQMTGLRATSLVLRRYDGLELLDDGLKPFHFGLPLGVVGPCVAGLAGALAFQSAHFDGSCATCHGEGRAADRAVADLVIRQVFPSLVGE